MNIVSKAALESIHAACRLLKAFQSDEEYQRFIEKCERRLLRERGIGGSAVVGTSGEASVLRSLIRRNDPVVFDVGANVGDFARAALAWRPNASVHCFEPSQAAHGILKTRLTKSPNVFLNQFALGEKRGQQVLFADSPGSGLSSLYKRRLNHAGIVMAHEDAVHIETLDHYCSERNVPRIDLLKIDVEGHELRVLEGSQSLFERGAIQHVMFEFGGTQIDSRTYLQDFFYFFERYRMRLLRITPSGYLHPLVRYREFDEQFLFTNFVAARAD
jgi:FkbM family methyltransferase